MLIRKKVSNFLVFETETILYALEKINSNKNRIVFVVSEDGRLVGSFGDGDFRRWVTHVENISLEQNVSVAMNTKVLFAHMDEHRSEIENKFSNSIDVLPLIDSHNRLVAVAFAKEKGLRIGDKIISKDSPVYIIAEIGNNHQGDILLAKQLVDLACEAGADCVKFQMRDMLTLYKSGANQDMSADLGSQYTVDLLNKFQLSNEDLISVFDYVKSKGLAPLCTPWDLVSLKVLEKYGMGAYKVASADLTNIELLDALARTGKPLICSTGMSTEAEIARISVYLKSLGVEFVLLHCNSTYPTPFKDVNLSYLPRLQEIGGTLIGYSGHERGISVPIAAVVMGAKVIEKHFTVDKSLEGNDHKVSLLPTEFVQMVRGIRDVEESMGSSSERVISQGEMINREVLAKSIIAVETILPGTVILRSMLEIKSPGQGLQPIYIDELVGKVVKRTVQKDGFFYESDLNDDIIAARNYSFGRPFGIPVRYHDYSMLTAKSNFDFVEFHLSYLDLDLDIDEFFSGKQNMGFAVHCPELFANDHILDLASNNTCYLERSLFELNRVCDVTRKLKLYFPKTKRPVIVVNVGGFCSDGFVSSEHRQAMYENVRKNLAHIDTGGVEIIIQTMPPFPWHFGGQSYHNIFVDPDEISRFCTETGLRICYDVSHSMMACNYYRWSLSDFTQKISKYIAHIHIVDALGVDGEGVEFGKGDVNFNELMSQLNSICPEGQFIPEVWQGHKNDGEGFWKALDYLEKYS